MVRNAGEGGLLNREGTGGTGGAVRNTPPDLLRPGKRLPHLPGPIPIRPYPGRRGGFTWEPDLGLALRGSRAPDIAACNFYCNSEHHAPPSPAAPPPLPTPQPKLTPAPATVGARPRRLQAQRPTSPLGRDAPPSSRKGCNKSCDRSLPVGPYPLPKRIF